MAHKRRSKAAPQPGTPGPVVAARAPGPVVVDLEEYELARRDKRLVRLLQDAAAEGARVVRQGRRRW